MSEMIQSLNSRHGIPNCVDIIAGRNGLPCIVVSTPTAEAEIYLHGAHVTRWKPAGQRKALFMSNNSAFAPGKPIRGGVPICFPWFGPKADDPKAPAHGFARLREFEIEKIERTGNAVCIHLKLSSDVDTRALWDADFILRHIITVDRTLSMRLQVDNTGPQSITFEEALHTYFAVSDIHNTAVEGLLGVSYVSKVDPVGTYMQKDPQICFDRETDRVYFDTTHACIIHDQAGNRRFRVEKEGSHTTVVWNPWIEKARRMEDFDDDRWPEMVCVETANSASNRVVLNPGAQHAMVARLSIDN